MAATVTITEKGRSGSVLYADGSRSITGHWEYGGNDVVTIVNMGTRTEWEQVHPWALEQRALILRVVADEVVRQRAPSCTAEIDAERGDILLRRSGAGAGAGAAGRSVSPQARSAAFVKRYTNLKAMLVIGMLVVTLVVGGVLWFGKKTLMVAPANGVPLGACVRTETHIASLLQTTDPHMAEISGRGGNTTTSLSILLIPLDGSAPFVVPAVQEYTGQGYGLSRIMGSDGRTLWFDCTGLFGVRLEERELVTPEDLRKANPGVDPGWWDDPRGMDIVDGRLHIINADRSAAMDLDPASWKAMPTAPKPSNARFERREPTDQFAAGLITSSGTWFGLHAPEELEGDFKAGKWVRSVEHATDAKRMRRLCRAELEPGPDATHFRIRSIVPLGDSTYLNGAFLRMDERSEPLRLTGPESALMVYTDRPGPVGRLLVSRVDLDGHLLWSVDTGLDRFNLQQVLPGAGAFAFVGTRPPVEGKLSEPLVVLVDNATGTLTMHSLWR